MEGHRPIVKQVWIAHVGDEGITPWDEAVEWTAVGPSRPPDEIVNGTIGVIPPATLPGVDEGTGVNEALLEFIKGILAYLNLIRFTTAAGE